MHNLRSFLAGMSIRKMRAANNLWLSSSITEMKLSHHSLTIKKWIIVFSFWKQWKNILFNCWTVGNYAVNLQRGRHAPPKGETFCIGIYNLLSERSFVSFAEFVPKQSDWIQEIPQFWKSDSSFDSSPGVQAIFTLPVSIVSTSFEQCSATSDCDQ